MPQPPKEHTEICSTSESFSCFAATPRSDARTTTNAWQRIPTVQVIYGRSHTIRFAFRAFTAVTARRKPIIIIIILYFERIGIVVLWDVVE